MTQSRDSQAARRRGEWARDRGSRAFDRAIHARRRLTTSQATGGATKADRHRPNPRHAIASAIARLKQAPARYPISTQGRSIDAENSGSNRSARTCPEVMLTEHVPSEMFSNDHYAGQLVERMGWALVDAETQERAIRA